MDTFISGLDMFLQPSSFIYLNIGLFLGLIFGSIPGLTVMLCLILFMPFTYSINAIESFMFLLGIYCAGSYGGSISAILIKTPGTPHAAATMLDGYPMAASLGQPKKALELALYASTFGGIFSALLLLFLAPQVASIAMKFGPPEYFILCMFGLFIISGVSSDSLPKGIIAGCLGLLLSTVGMDSISGTFRFTFDNFNLFGGLGLVVVLIGLFAIAEILSHARLRKPEGFFKQVQLPRDTDKGLNKEELTTLIPTMMRSSIIGSIIGAIPGTGASMASFLSYDTARRKSGNPEQFGKGSSEGIVAAESANNAVTGATLIPLLTLGIPGDASVAILVGTLMINGLTPGPNLFQEHGTTVYAIMIGLIFINIFMFIQGKLLMRHFAKVAKVDRVLLTPIIVLFCFAGAYSINNTMFDIYISLTFGLLSYLLIKLKFSPVPILLGLVLGPLTEMNLRRSLIMSQGDLIVFVQRPMSIILIALFFGICVWFLASKLKKNNLRQGSKKVINH